MRVCVRYVEGCPSRRVVEGRLREVLAERGHSGVEIELEVIATPEQARAMAFRGSPTVLVDGEDPFLDESAPVGLACRIYQTGDGPRGAPDVDQLRAVLRP